jgi:CD2 antigen cytoplasmic tail-binding protein 2
MSSRPAAPRPKRGGEEFSRTHYHQDEGPFSKKPRFDVRNPSALAPDALEEDAVLEADEIGRRGQQTKRNAVNIDGYGSDSSNEGFDARVEAKAKEAKERGNTGPKSQKVEESDMFADLAEELEDEELADEGKKKKKNVRFLDVDEIEGQVEESKSGGHVSADFSLNGQDTNRRRNKPDAESSSSESDVDEAERAELNGKVDVEVGAGGKKEHAPRLDAFNMKSEQEEGRFDAHGNFVRKAADPDAVHDSWLEGVSKRDMKKAKEAADKRDEERRRKALQDDAVLTSDVLRTLIPYLERGETVLEALARLGPGKDSKRKPKWQHTKAKNKRSTSSHENKNGKDMDVVTEASSEDAVENHRREAVEAITGAADQLLTRGQADIYDAEREVLMRQYRRETGEDWVDEGLRPEAGEDNADDVSKVQQWEYRWPDGRDGGEAHGPYDGAMMAGWTEAGYFADGGVEVRRVGEGGEWSRSANFE